MNKPFVRGVLLLIVFIQVTLAGKFDYSFSGDKGPNKWATLFPDYCNKSSQSPIDIVVSKTNYDDKLGSITFTGYSTIPSGPSVQAGNNGHSFRVIVKPNTFSISGGGLTGTYTLHSFHLHWGSVDTKGSEHTVDGKKFPAELHLVHFNNKYSNLSEAVTKADGLAVLGVFLSVGSENAALQSFLKYAANTTEQPRGRGSHRSTQSRARRRAKTEMYNLTQTHKLEDMLPSNTSHFYRYSGSLTTPNCNEVVTWTVFNTTGTISTAQLNLLRNLKENNSTMIVDNYRPVQDLNSRVVKCSFMIKDDNDGPDNGAYHVTNHVEIIMAFIVAALFKFFQ